MQKKLTQYKQFEHLKESLPSPVGPSYDLQASKSFSVPKMTQSLEKSKADSIKKRMELQILRNKQLKTRDKQYEYEEQESELSSQVAAFHEDNSQPYQEQKDLPFQEVDLKPKPHEERIKVSKKSTSQQKVSIPSLPQQNSSAIMPQKNTLQISPIKTRASLHEKKVQEDLSFEEMIKREVVKDSEIRFNKGDFQYSLLRKGKVYWITSDQIMKINPRWIVRFHLQFI